MIRTLLATTALAALLASGAHAQTTTAPADTTTPPAATETAPAAEVERADGHLASNLIGEQVYNGTGDDAETVGDVNDLVIGADGAVEQIVVGVGGFLGLGEKNVAIPYADIDWADRDGDRWIVITATADQLKEQPAFERAAYEPAAGGASTTAAAPAATDTMATTPTTAPATDTTAAAPATDTTTAAPATDPATDNVASAPEPAATDTMATAERAPTGTAAGTEAQSGDSAPAAADTTTPADSGTQTAAIDRSTLKPLDTAQITAEQFLGTNVYGANDESIGEIGDVVVGEGGKVDTVIIDVGGFLGMGEKPVAVALDNLAFLTDEDGDRYLYTEWTKEQLEAQPAYDEATYAENRDTMRMTVPN